MPQRTMPTLDLAKTKAKKMNKIGVKRTKCNNAVQKEMLKRKKLEKKLEDEDSTCQPNIFEAKDLEDEVDVCNQKPPPETISFQEEVRVSQSSNTVTDGTKNISPIVHNLNTNDHCKKSCSFVYKFICCNKLFS
jgi:hypothetical protein